MQLCQGESKGEARAPFRLQTGGVSGDFGDRLVNSKVLFLQDSQQCSQFSGQHLSTILVRGGVLTDMTLQPSWN